MSKISQLTYPADEMALKEKLDAHLNSWKKELLKTDLQKELVKDMVFDGFYPYYTQQKKRVLFIGKEATQIAGCNYIDILYGGFKANKIGNKTLDQHQFSARLFYLAYGIYNNFPAYSEVPCASELAKKFAEKNGLSFAFMNVSKLSNESGKWQADIDLINLFLDAQKHLSKNYFAEEIDILNPDLIISMNLIDTGFFNKAETHNAYTLKPLENIVDCVNVYHLITTKNNKYPVFDMYHFSMLCNAEEVFYKPLENVYRQYFK